jgi:hypothetical protein
MKEITPWIEEEMATLDLGHKAREKRLKIVMSQLAAMPAASIPAAVGGGRAEMEAAYRLFDNDAIEFDAIIAAHAECSTRSSTQIASRDSDAGYQRDRSHVLSNT